jgi:DNA-directed RNA polymerase subunit beta
MNLVSLEAPYRKVEKITRGKSTKMKITDEVVYLAADDETDHYITHAEVKIDDQGYITEEWVPVSVIRENS